VAQLWPEANAAQSGSCSATIGLGREHRVLDRQIAQLKSAGCKQIFKQKQSGQEGIKRPQLDKAIDALSRG
jgi:hypothetical protein